MFKKPQKKVKVQKHKHEFVETPFQALDGSTIRMRYCSFPNCTHYEEFRKGKWQALK